MMIRSFLAFELPLEIKKGVSRVFAEIRGSIRNIRWVNVDNIHLTIVFMGNVSEDLIPPINEAVEKVCLRYGPFYISLSGLGAFPNTRRPRVVWLGLQGDTERMSFFKKALHKHIKPFGIKEEKRPFKPHLTLGRFRNPAPGDSSLDNFIAKYKDLSSPECQMDELILFKSDLNPGGAVYTKLKSWPLSGQ
jgi:2'-5' RNA ligase